MNEVRSKLAELLFSSLENVLVESVDVTGMVVRVEALQSAELVPAVVAVQSFEVGEDILAGHLPQVVVAVRPAQQCRTAPLR
ncbi:hypothetical protein ACIREE_27640 [Streptomyces sp. NPDC102467]|uniref:hypothetical protein n=1 Tax=Streptomyces sp. NPDC102467 TaxID=3366179 RepID=UPI00380417BA